MFRRFVNLHMGLARFGQVYTISTCVPLIFEKEFIIEVDDEVTLNYVLDYVRRGHVRVVGEDLFL